MEGKCTGCFGIIPDSLGSCPNCGKSKESKSKIDLFLCTSCHSQVSAKLKNKGSMGLEFLLWLFFIVPGFIYSLWRLTNKERLCPQCGSKDLIPMDSPRAQAILKQAQIS